MTKQANVDLDLFIQKQLLGPEKPGRLYRQQQQQMDFRERINPRTENIAHSLRITPYLKAGNDGPSTPVRVYDGKVLPNFGGGRIGKVRPKKIAQLNKVSNTEKQNLSKVVDEIKNRIVGSMKVLQSDTGYSSIPRHTVPTGIGSEGEVYPYGTTVSDVIFQKKFNQLKDALKVGPKEFKRKIDTGFQLISPYHVPQGAQGWI